MWQANNEEDMHQAVMALAEGKLVAFPTETVYGLGGNGLSESVCQAIYEAKGRPSDNPLILHIADMDSFYRLAKTISPTAEQLAQAFWPGPLTLIVEKSDAVPFAATGGLSTVAIRWPDHPLAQQLIKASGLPLAAPSANTSGRPSPTRAWHVAEDLGERIAGIVDGGATTVGIESTIIDCTHSPPRLLRPGGLAKEAIEALIGPIDLATSLNARENPLAPGMKYRHYAPAVPVVLLSDEEALPRLHALIKDETGPALGLLLPDELIGALGEVPARIHYWNLGSHKRPELAAARLFDGLRRLEDAGVEKMYVTTWSESDIGLGLMNRIYKLARAEEDSKP